MGWLRKKRPCDGKAHTWSRWDFSNTNNGLIYHRSCECGAIQRHVARTGEITIWMPDGVGSGLLDQGLTRKVYEEL